MGCEGLETRLGIGCFVAAPPATTVQVDDCGNWSLNVGPVEVEQELGAVGLGIGDVRGKCHGCHGIFFLFLMMIDDDR